MSFVKRTASNLISIAGAGFVFWSTYVLVSPNFWASISVNEPWVIVLKLGAALMTFVFLKAITSPGKDSP